MLNKFYLYISNKIRRKLIIKKIFFIKNILNKIIFIFSNL